MKSKYEIDPHNRLIVKKQGKSSNVKKFRQVVHGQFKTDKKNKLIYEVSKASESDVPQKIKFSGKYFLDKGHNLIMTLNKWNNQINGNRLTLNTKIIDANGSEIVFLANSKTSEGKTSMYMMKLYGSWRVDKNNRLTFGVKKENDKTDTLTLFSAWKINDNNEIIYSAGGKSDVITFRGHWDIKDRYRIGYILDESINSGFDFRASLGQIAPRDKKAYMTFDVAIDISKKERVRRKIVFSGNLKLNKGTDVGLEISPDSKKNISLKLTKEMVGKEGFGYIEAHLKNEERYVGGGIVFRW